jgi:proline dehydrogenase
MRVARLPGATGSIRPERRDPVGPLLRRSLLALSRSRAARLFVTHAPPARAVARRFVAGERRADALRVVHELAGQRMMATVAFLGEHVETRQQAEAYAAEYLRLADDLSGGAHVSLKLSALGLDVDEALCRRLLERVAERASFVRIDMESSAYVEPTLRLFRDVHAAHPNVGIVLQAYLRRTGRDVEAAIRLGARVRLCKGAYDELSSVALTEKSDIDGHYVTLAERLLEAGDYPAFATHDQRIVEHLVAHAAHRRLPPNSFEFQMLHGIRRDLQRWLVDRGHLVRVYVPYGSHWYPYFMRRLAERPGNLRFFLRSLF